MVKQILFAILAALMVAPAYAALTSSNVPAHTHASVQQGGALGAVSTTSVTATGVVTGSGFMTTSTLPAYTFEESDGASSNKRWRFIASNENFYLQLLGDASQDGPFVFWTSRTGMVSDAITFSTTVASDKACATGFTRKTPNYCAANAGAFTNVALTRDACTSVALPSADAKVVHFQAALLARSANAIAARSAQINAFNDAACTNPAGLLTAQSIDLYEFVATAAGTTIGSMQAMFLVPTPTIYLQFTDDAGNQGIATYNFRGYID